jgi:hypothetical protein
VSYMAGVDGCCGISEIVNIYDDECPENTLMEVEPNRCGVAFFSDINGYGYGRQLERLIKKCRLGAVIALPPTVNPNSGNKVKVWSWKVNNRALKAWQKKFRKSDPDGKKVPLKEWEDGYEYPSYNYGYQW